jgi:hypothetical protein
MTIMRSQPQRAPNVFVKPNDQSQTCLSFGMTRRRRGAPFVRRMKSNSWQNVYT